MSDDDIPRAVSSSTLRLGDIDVTVHVLDDGRRIIDRDDFLRLLGIVLDGEADDDV